MNSQKLRGLGWKSAFAQQLSDVEAETMLAARVAAHLGNRIQCWTEDDEFSLPTPLPQACDELAVGDWLLLEPDSRRVVRRLERESILARKTAGELPQAQLIAANLDTLFIVSSCNHDFNASRLERYLSLAAEAAVNAVVILTRADLCDDPGRLRQQASALKSGLIVETLDARDRVQAGILDDWCRLGQTVALVGSSGVGKSTLAMSLGAPALATQQIREDDSKGRHTTTARWIHRLDAGGLLIDTPGMRELQLLDCQDGVAEVFDDVIALADACRFRDCQHMSEPGCAVRAAIDAGDLDPRRLKSYRKLLNEQARNSQSLRERRDESRRLGQYYKAVQSSKRERQQGDS